MYSLGEVILERKGFETFETLRNVTKRYETLRNVTKRLKPYETLRNVAPATCNPSPIGDGLQVAGATFRKVSNVTKRLKTRQTLRNVCKALLLQPATVFVVVQTFAPATCNCFCCCANVCCWRKGLHNNKNSCSQTLRNVAPAICNPAPYRRRVAGCRRNVS